MKARTVLMILAILIVIAFLIFARQLPFGGDARTAKSSPPATQSATSVPRVATTQTLPTDVQKKTLERRATKRAPTVRKPKVERARVKITNSEGRPVPELVAVAKECGPRYAITGKLEEHTEEPGGGVGIGRRIEVRDRGNLVSAFSLRERGVGVTVDSARRQAFMDLAWSLRRHLEPMR